VVAWGRGDHAPDDFARSFAIIHNVFESAPTLAEEYMKAKRRILTRYPSDRAKYTEDPVRYAERHAGAPGSAAARQRALRARQIYEGLLPEIDAFRQLSGVEIVPSRAFKTWLPQQVKISTDLS